VRERESVCVRKRERVREREGECNKLRDRDRVKWIRGSGLEVTILEEWVSPTVTFASQS
jgi:hypothetical protein